MHIRCKVRGRKGHVGGVIRFVRVRPQGNADRIAMQAFLEDVHMVMNRGECQSYSICEYCREPDRIPRSSPTPCADALFRRYEATQKTDISIIPREEVYRA